MTPASIRVMRAAALAFVVASTYSYGQTKPTPTRATAAWTVKVNGAIRWQQVTPAGALLVATDNALSAV
ncbi:MAG TPA: hypothetical protein VJR04_06940, partial [Terriglobales bacterium]|nr:hypothetical protein [Terriglobales bacterium]